MKGEKYLWAIIIMIFVGVGIVFGYLFFHDQEVRALNAGSPGNAAQYSTLKYAIIGAGIGLEVLVLLWVLKTKLAERPKRLKVRLAGLGKKKEKPQVIKVRVAGLGRKGEKPKVLKLRAAEPKEEKKLKVRAVELSPAEKEGQIKEIIGKLWAEKGEASMDEIIGEATKYGIGKRDVEKYIENEKKRGRLDTAKA